MHQLVVGFVVCSALLSVACGDNYGEADHLVRGMAIFELPSAAGMSFEAAISVSPDNDPAAVTQLAADQDDLSLDVELLPGNYTATLDSFTLYDEGQPVPEVEVTFVGFEPNPIVITPLATTRVSLAFEVGEDNVIDSNRDAELIINGGCTPGCTAAQKCADVNETGPACYATCNDTTPCADSTATCVAEAGICL
jgi:hypothetical protein